MARPIKPILLGCSGLDLLQAEREFFTETNPFGFILFQRNCQSPEQLRKLTQDLRNSLGRIDTPIFIDQEGGRVARLKPPHWPALPSMKKVGELFEANVEQGRKALKLHVQITAAMLQDVGINGNCAPVLDLFIDGMSPAIGDRTFSGNPKAIAELGGIAIETYLEHCIFPVIKHMPGHGRVTIDPHIDLPFVEAKRDLLKAQDFVPFIALKDAPIGMNCHVVFKDLDPDHPVSLSRRVHDQVIRGEIGFKGLLFSDDLAMGALKLPLQERAACALKAGADIILYCPGTLPENREICAGLPPISAETLRRWDITKSLARCRNPKTTKMDDLQPLLAELQTLIPA